MADHNIASMTESEEMYLVWIARIGEAGADGPVPISQLAEQMRIQPVSVNQMIHKLEELGLVEYTPYQGVTLSPEGMRYAQDILHRRRLWEVFLVEHLHLSLGEADELACRMEHIFPTDALSRLDDFLGHPSRSPSDKHIPRRSDPEVVEQSINLDSLEPGGEGEVVTIDLDHATRIFLKSEGLQPGVCLKLLARGSRGSVLISTGAGSNLTIVPELAARIWLSESNVEN
jgi:DtxR family Mn-dependent transcriptional regulator